VNPASPNSIATSESFEFDALQEAKNYRAALLREFRPYLKGLVVEVGAGIGQFTRELAAVPTVKKIVAIEPESKFADAFRSSNPGCDVINGTINDLQTSVEPDAIVCINVLEHIESDAAELVKFRERLAPRQGHLCLFVPARPELYAPIDRDFGHYRRYRLPELRAKLSEAGFSVRQIHYFNWVGYFGWWLNFCVLKKRKFDVASIRLFDRMIFPVVNALEYRFVRPPFGQSLVAVAQSRRS
jgi:SAM-dependent methyltransferase